MIIYFSVSLLNLNLNLRIATTLSFIFVSLPSKNFNQRRQKTKKRPNGKKEPNEKKKILNSYSSLVNLLNLRITRRLSFIFVRPSNFNQRCLEKRANEKMKAYL